MADQKKQRVSVKITDLDTGTEQMSADLTVIPGWGFCCSCSTSSLTTTPPVVQSGTGVKAT